jgi:hypothetical protein
MKEKVANSSYLEYMIDMILFDLKLKGTAEQGYFIQAV